MKKYQVVLFDVDETLVDRASAFERWITSLMDAHPEVFPAARRQSAASRLRQIDERGRRDRLSVCQQILEEFPGMNLSPEELRWKLATGVANHVRPRPSVSGLLERLRARLRVGIVSNGIGSLQRAKLINAHLRIAEDGVFISDELGWKKPDRRIFEHALQWAGCPPGDALFIGDDPERDVVGAASLGMSTAWVSHGEPWPARLAPPEYTLARIEDVEALLP